MTAVLLVAARRCFAIIVKVNKMIEKITENEWKFINEILLQIHGNDDIDSMRKEMFDMLQYIVKFDYGAFFLCKDDGVTNPIGYNISKEELEKDTSHIEEINPLKTLRGLMMDPKHPAIRVSEYIFTEKLEDTEYYNLIWKPKRIRYSILVGIGYKGRELGSINLYRIEDKNDFSDKDLEILNILKAHLNIRLYRENIPYRINPDESSLKTIYRLTDRETEIVELWIRGLTDNEISDRLAISKNTLKKHISNVFGKLEINSRVELLKIISSLDDRK